MKILLVEDNELNCDMLKERLTRKGFDVIIAANGEEGITMAKQTLPDIILMDMGLPIVDGWAATRQIKSCQETSGIPIIGLTAHALAGDREKALLAGCNDYETKPIEFSRLLEKIEKLIGLL